MKKTLSVLLFGILMSSSAYAAVKPGSTPPDYLGKTVHGQAVRLSALRGKVVVISFWATWCHYCLKEIPVLAGFQSVATRHGLPMQVVAVNEQQSRHVFAEASHVLNSRFPKLLITRDFNGGIGKPYGVDKGIPVMVMLHRDGTVAYIHVGYGKGELDTLLKEINGLLNEPVTKATATRTH